MIHLVDIPSPMAGMGSSSQCSSSTSFNSLKETDDDHMIAVMMSEEYANLDNEVAKRLSNLAPVPLVPRINSFIPTYSDASMDHQRLIQRLHVYGLCEVRVSGDGNCQFRALSDQMFKSPEYHKHVRKDIVKQLKEHRPFYEGYVPMEYKKYYKKIAKSGEWGDHVTLQAAADRFGAKICLLTSFRDTCFIEILPRVHEPKRVLWLSFWSEVHYNSLYTIQGSSITNCLCSVHGCTMDGSSGKHEVKLRELRNQKGRKQSFLCLVSILVFSLLISLDSNVILISI
ncbi:uncharacterized protein [Phyllobates terribilis]|uniref:uncharacterized protein n=1 Tax=Phyllobates terribilis TaxID=111132 RepID=UPI003CCAF121